LEKLAVEKTQIHILRYGKELFFLVRSSYKVEQICSKCGSGHTREDTRLQMTIVPEVLKVL
jgi:hypothetical protein